MLDMVQLAVNMQEKCILDRGLYLSPGHSAELLTYTSNLLSGYHPWMFQRKLRHHYLSCYLREILACHSSASTSLLPNQSPTLAASPSLISFTASCFSHPHYHQLCS